MVSLEDVARQANVSLTTASRVLSSSPHPVSDEKRERVLLAARELNYSPSLLAQAMVTGDTHIVGVIVGDAADPYFASIVRGVEDVARANHYLVIVCDSDRDPEVELSYVQTLNSYRVDGVIFAGGGLSDAKYLAGIEPLLKNFRERGAGFVSLGKQLFPSYSVLVNFKELAHDAVEYLTGLGHRKIAYISGPPLLTTTQHRFEGYATALKAHQITINPDYLFEGDFKYESGKRAGEQISAMQNRPTAVMASNDLMALGCMTALKESGLRIPEDISVIGIDDIPFAKFIEPSLTTVSIPLYELGKIGMESLLQLRAGDAALQEEVFLPHKLIVRNSTAKPAAP